MTKFIYFSDQSVFTFKLNQVHQANIILKINAHNLA